MIRFFANCTIRMALALGAMLSIGYSAHAQNIRVTVLTILASDRHNKIDDQIKEIAEEIQKAEEMQKKKTRLTGFKHERTFGQSIEQGQSVKVTLVDKQTVEVCVNEKPDAEGRVTLTIKPPDLGEITYACSCGKFFPIVTNYYTTNAKKEKERLIIAVMAKPCTKKK